MILFIVLVVICFIAMLVYHFASQGRALSGTATVAPGGWR